jgi:hypothetical protein
LALTTGSIAQTAVGKYCDFNIHNLTLPILGKHTLEAKIKKLRKGKKLAPRMGARGAMGFPEIIILIHQNKTGKGLNFRVCQTSLLL